jgi:hypothetical protein
MVGGIHRGPREKTPLLAIDRCLARCVHTALVSCISASAANAPLAMPGYDARPMLNVPATMDKTVSWTACIFRV